MWYKPSLLAKYGLSVPTTFNQFMADCKVFKAHGITLVYVSGKDGYQNILFAGIYNQLIMKDTPVQPGDHRQPGPREGVLERYARTGRARCTRPPPGIRGGHAVHRARRRPASRRQTAPGEWAVNIQQLPVLHRRLLRRQHDHPANPSLKPRFLRLPRHQQPVLEPGSHRRRPHLDGPGLGQAPDAGPGVAGAVLAAVQLRRVGEGDRVAVDRDVRADADAAVDLLAVHPHEQQLSGARARCGCPPARPTAHPSRTPS